jgi:hypothetical protein
MLLTFRIEYLILAMLEQHYSKITPDLIAHQFSSGTKR